MDTNISNPDYNLLLEQSLPVQGGMGAIAWAALEMLKRGGMPADKIEQLNADMNKYFANPSNDECNTILKVVETRLRTDKDQDADIWYS